MNLLPLGEQQNIRREYRRRLTVATLSCLAGVLFIVFISFAVTYSVSSYEITSLRQEVETLSKTDDVFQAMVSLEKIEDANRKMRILSLDLSGDLTSVTSSSTAE